MSQQSTSCCSPRGRGLFAGHFTSIISGIECAGAALQLFGAMTTGGSVTILISLAKIIFLVTYIIASRVLISAIREEKGEKFLFWIIMSGFNVIGCVVVTTIIIIGLVNVSTLQDDSLIYLMVAILVLVIIYTLVLIFCLWSVISLWCSYGKNRVQGSSRLVSELEGAMYLTLNPVKGVEE